MLINLDHAHNQLTAKVVSNEADLSVEEVIFKTPTPTVGNLCELTVKVKNSSTIAYHGDLGISKKGGGWLDALGCDIEPGKNIVLNLSFKPQEAGELIYYVQDRINVLYTGTMTVAENNQNSNCDLTITHQVTNAEGTEIAALKAKLDLTVTNNSDHDYYGGIYV